MPNTYALPLLAKALNERISAPSMKSLRINTTPRVELLRLWGRANPDEKCPKYIKLAHNPA